MLKTAQSNSASDTGLEYLVGVRKREEGENRMDLGEKNNKNS